MPKERFERLSEIKKQRIAEALMSEMETVPLEKLNVCHVAQKAGVSRGSLYLYFENKEDMIAFSVCQEAGRKLEKDRSRLEENGGDYWDMMADSLKEWIVRSKKKPENRRMLCCLPDGGEVYFLRNQEEKNAERIRYHKDWIYQNCSNGEIRHLTRSEFDALDDLCRALMTVSFQEYVYGNQNPEKMLCYFRDRLELVRSGLSRRI